MTINHSFYQGDNIHAYTPMIRSQLGFLLNRLPFQYDRVEFQNAITNAMEKYQQNSDLHQNPNFLNGIQNILNTAEQMDAELKEIHIGQLFLNIWKKLLLLNENSLFQHFKETIEQIGGTCIQGVSHRLFLDAIVLFDSE